MKRKITKIAGLLCLLAYTSTTFAATIGTYIGAGGGRSSARIPTSSPFDVSIYPQPSSATKTTVGWSERVFAGYNFTDYFGIEIGWNNWNRSLYNARTPFGNSAMQYNFRDYDAIGKIYFPIGYTGANLYALAGAARVTETLTYTDNGVILSGIIAEPNPGVTHASNTRPMYGVGGNITLYRRFTINLEVFQISSVGNFTNNPTAIPFLTMGYLGFAYNFQM
ncbi:MAG: outer membrane beta-barrel protein [Pseudomonadota bacterium]